PHARLPAQTSWKTSRKREYRRRRSCFAQRYRLPDVSANPRRQPSVTRSTVTPQIAEGYSPLTHRAEKRRAPVLHHPLHGAAASRCYTRFALAVIDAEMMLEIAKLAIGVAVVAQ